MDCNEYLHDNLQSDDELYVDELFLTHINNVIICDLQVKNENKVWFISCKFTC